MRELTLEMLNRCEYIILDRDDYLRGIEDPALECIKNKKVLFIRQDVNYLDNVQELRRAARYNGNLAEMLTELKNKTIVILSTEFFSLLSDYVYEEASLKDIGTGLTNLLSRESQVT